MRVLLVEDDRMIGEAVSQSLKEAAYAVDWVRDGQSAITSLQSQDYEVVLLDLGLPKVDGMDVLQQIRAKGNAVPVLVMTARDTLDDRIRGLDGGADDYMLKPFDIEEMQARIRAVVRRKAGVVGPALSNGTMSLDPLTKEVSMDGKQNRLSSREFSLLQALLVRPGAILSRTDLENRIYGWNEEVESNAVEFLIHSLRKKLGSGAIKNVRGMGWMVSKGN